jgi:uncharacterized membrane protein
MTWLRPTTTPLAGWGPAPETAVLSAQEAAADQSAADQSTVNQSTVNQSTVNQSTVAEVTTPQEDTATSWRLLEAPAPWVVVLVVLPLSFAVAWRAYARETLSSGMRTTLVGLRWLSLLALLAILARPVEVRSQERVTPAEILVLADDSASMSRRDAYSGAEEVARKLQALLPSPGEGEAPLVAETSRAELTSAWLDGRLLPHLAETGYEVRLQRFATTTEALADPGNLAGRGAATHLGDALASALSQARGRHVKGIVVVGDGRSNGGADPMEVAERASQAGIPVHTVVVGDTRPERNLVLELVEAPTSVLEEDEISLIVRVRARGLEGGAAVEVLLEEIEGGQAQPVDQQRVEPTEEGLRVTLTAPGRRTGSRGLERRFRVSVAPLPEERMLDDNQVATVVRVNPERIRVLYVDGYPRWEYRQLKDMLLRADERIEAQMFLLSATPDFPQEATRGLDRLTRVPTRTEQLLDRYDVVVLGDVNPWAISADPAEGEEFVRSLGEFVEKGGGLCVIAGEFDMPKAVAGTEFAKLLPVTLDPTGALAFEVDTTLEQHPTLEDPSSPHQIVRLHPDADLNRQLWQEEGGLRGFYWYFPVRGAKPGAQVLLRHPTQSLSGDGERDPLLVAGYYPEGRTLFLAIDSTHRWQFRYEHRYHERFWRNAIRWLALGRLKGGDRRHQLEALQPEYGLDERVSLEARVLNEDFEPLEAESRTVELEGPDGELERVELAADPNRPGVFRTSFEAGRAGAWSAVLLDADEPVARADYEVVLPSHENADPTPDPAALLALSQRTGGSAVALASAGPLLQALPGGEERREPLRSDLLDAWDRWGTLALVLALLSAEWILRKRLELI